MVGYVSLNYFCIWAGFGDTIKYMGELLIATIILFAVFTQAMAGFGVALISMPLVTKLLLNMIRRHVQRRLPLDTGAVIH